MGLRPEFMGYGKTPHLFRDMTITEKIHGTNAGIIVQRVTDENIMDIPEHPQGWISVVHGHDGVFLLGAQSRKNIITPQKDNAGFARFVADNAFHLVNTLGEGRHFGEWYGHGVQGATYGLAKGEKRLALFNTSKWKNVYAEDGSKFHPQIEIVPTLYTGRFDLNMVQVTLDLLLSEGSRAGNVPNDTRPEGVVVFHHESRQVFKYREDDRHKWEIEQEAALLEHPAGAVVLSAPIPSVALTDEEFDGVIKSGPRPSAD